MNQIRCAWVKNQPLEINYHDLEWGVPVYNDQKLFEFLLLESAQAGLSWSTILQKRENYRRLFANFDPKIIANFSEEKKQQLLTEKGIIRHKLKIEAAVNNAQKFLEIQEEFSSFSNYIWGFVDGKTKQNNYQNLQEIPPKTQESQQMSQDLKKEDLSLSAQLFVMLLCKL